MAIQFKKATKHKAKLRLALVGPPGSGKTYSALAIGTNLGSRVVVIDTEHGSASLYAGRDGFDFDVLELDDFSPRTYVEAIKAAEKEGYDVIVIDSMTHAWAGKGGALEMVNDAQRRQKTPNSYTAWRDVTPEHNALVDAIVQSKCHVVATMRAKTEYVQEKDERGRTVIRKVGLAPVQREGTEYEFTLVADIDSDHVMTVTKSRCSALADAVVRRPGKDVAEKLMLWLSDGDAPEPSVRTAAPPPAPSEPHINDRASTLISAFDSAESPEAIEAIAADMLAQHKQRSFSESDRTALKAARAAADSRFKAA